MKSLYCSHCGAVVLSDGSTTEAQAYYAMKFHQNTCRQALQADAKSSQDICPSCLTDCYLQTGKACSGAGIYAARKGGMNTTQPQKSKIQKSTGEEQTNSEGELVSFSKLGKTHEEIGGAGGDWLRFKDGDEHILKVVGDGLKLRDGNFKDKNGDPRKEYIMECEVDGKPMKWSFSAKSQHADKIIEALMAGKRKLRIMRDGDGPTNTRYVVKAL